MPRSARTLRQVHQVRESILDAAVHEFSRHGYAAVTMRDIAKAAGYTAPSLYNYFASKDEIFAAVYQRVCDAFDGAFGAPTISRLTFEQRLELLVRRILDLSVTHRDAFAMLLNPQAGPHLSEALARERLERFQSHLARLATWLRESNLPAELAGIDVDTLAYLLWGVLHAVQIRGLIDPERPSTPELDTKRVTQFFLHGALGVRRAS